MSNETESQTEDEKSLYNVAKKFFEKENLQTPDSLMQFKEKIAVEISDIDSQLKTAEDSGVTLNQRHKKGTQEYFTWRRKAESSRNIKNCQLHIVKRELEAFNVKKENKWERKYQEELAQRVRAETQVKILTGAIDDYLDRFASDRSRGLEDALKEAENV